MKYLIAFLMITTTGCSYFSPADLKLAEQYCEPYGGWKSIKMQRVMNLLQSCSLNCWRSSQ